MSGMLDADNRPGHVTWSLDLVVAGLLFVFTVLPLAVMGVGTQDTLAEFTIGTALCAATVLRRRHPLWTLTLVAGLCLLHAALLPWPTPALLTVLLVAYSVARWVPGHRSRSVLVLAVIGGIVGPGRWLGSAVLGTTGGDAAVPLLVLMVAGMGCTGLVVTCYAIGRRVRESAMAQDERMRAEAERRVLAAAEQAQSARVAEVQARSQIARELHDIVAHSLSVIIVQAEGGRALAKKQPDQAAVVLDTIAETGREALGEMRRIVDVLRGGPADSADYAPTPGLADIAELVQRSGDRAHLVVDGTPPEVSPTLGLTVYRVVQEALTNVLKHAGPDATAEVVLTYTPALIVAEVTDDGAGPTTGDGHGHGLQGMRERVTAMDGQLVTRPGAGGGFLVRAIVPVPPRVPEPSRTPAMKEIP